MVRQAVRNEAGPAHGHTTSSRRKSPVWKDFDYVNGPGGTAMGKCRRCDSMFQASSKGHGTSAMLRHAKSPCCAKRAAKRAAQGARPCLPPAAPAAADDNDDEDEQAPCLPAAAAAPDSADDNDDEDEQAPCLPAAAAPAPDDDLEWRAMVKSIDDLHKHPGYDAFLFSREEQQDGGLTTTSSPSADLTTADLPFTNGDHHRCSPNNHGMPDMPQAHSSSSMRFFRKKRERSANSASHQGETTDKSHSSLVNTDWASTVDDSMVYTGFTFGDRCL